MTTCASTTPIMAANWQHVDISVYYKHSWNHDHMRRNDTDYGGKLTTRASIPLQLDFLPCTDVPLMGLPSEVTHQQKPVAEWHCTSAYVPSVLQSGINTPNVGFLASFTASSRSFIQLLACRPEAESEGNVTFIQLLACRPEAEREGNALLIRSEWIFTFIQLLAGHPEAESEGNAYLYAVSIFLLFVAQFQFSTIDLLYLAKYHWVFNSRNTCMLLSDFKICWIILSSILLMYFVKDYLR